MIPSLIAAVAVLAAAPAVGPPRAFTAPFQPWASPDGRVHLLRPATVQPTTSEQPLGSLMGSGWRLVWDGSAATPGRMVVRLVLKVSPTPPEKTASEVLQVGVSRTPAALRTCLAYGLKGGSGRRMPDRVINGVTYTVWSNGDAGMSQQIAATDLRAVVGGACYAVERFSYAESASDGDPSATLPQAQGARMLDRSLASLQIGRVPPDEVIQPPRLHLPPHAIAR